MNKILLSLLFAIISFGLQAQTLDIPEVQYSLVTKRTATWCPNCGNYAWDMMENLTNSYNDKALSIKAHHSSSSVLHSSTAAALIDNLEDSFYQPVFFVGEQVAGGGSSNVENGIIDAINSNFMDAPLAQSGIAITYDPTDGSIFIDTETQFFSAADGDYRLSVFVIEKAVVATQANQGTNTTHTNVLRSNLSGGDFEGPLKSGSIAADEIIQKSFTTSLDAADMPAVDNFIIATVIWEFEGGSYKFVNVNFTDEVNLVTSTTQLTEENASIKVFPTITTTNSTLQIDAKSTLGNTQIVTIAPDGRIIGQIFTGELNTGTHHFQIEAAQLGAKGTYLVGIRTNKGQKTIPLIIK